MTATSGAGRTASKAQRLAPDERRRLIIEATIACLASSGPEKWTLRQVSRDMGVAPSLVTYFFSTWSELLTGAYMSLSTRYEEEFSSIARRDDLDPEARLALYIERYFSDDWSAEGIAGAYVAFWALGRSEPRLREAMLRFGDMKRRDLFPLLAEVAEGRGFTGDLEPVAESFYFLISGLWYEVAVNPGSVSGPGPVARAARFLDHALG